MDIFSYHLEILFKKIWHQIPAWTHIKTISICLKHTCTTSSTFIFFIQRNLVSLFGQQYRRRKSSDSSSDDGDGFGHYGLKCDMHEILKTFYSNSSFGCFFYVSQLVQQWLDILFDGLFVNTELNCDCFEPKWSGGLSDDLEILAM